MGDNRESLYYDHRPRPVASVRPAMDTDTQDVYITTDDDAVQNARKARRAPPLPPAHSPDSANTAGDVNTAAEIYGVYL